MKPISLLVPVVLAAALAPLAAIEITLPAETDRLIESKLAGYTLATTYCYTCHSTDYVRVQPPAYTGLAAFGDEKSRVENGLAVLDVPQDSQVALCVADAQAAPGFEVDAAQGLQARQ